MQRLIECVPNFSEGRDSNLIKQITDQIDGVKGVRLLDVDPGMATNRTVVTFIGDPEAVIEVAFRAIKKATELIDMSKHSGEHSRMGATDVCPLIPVAGVTMEETVIYAKKLGERIGRELSIPVYLYEQAATIDWRRNLAVIREGEYEGLPAKLADPKWKPDYGPAVFNSKSGASVVGVRDFLVAYNANLNTTSTRRANSIAFDIREAGRLKRKGDPVTGVLEKDDMGNPIRIPGSLKCVKAVGWYIKEYGIAQISVNLTNINVTPLHVVFDEICKKAEERGLRVTGSEIVGMVPLKCLLDAGKYFLKKQKRSIGVSRDELIHIAIKSMGLNDVVPFDPKKKIIEFAIKDKDDKLVDLTLSAFTDETASESPAPGGGSISAYVGALGVSLATMVANLSSHKRGWDDRWEEFSLWAEKGQKLKEELLFLVDEDTLAFNQIMSAFGMAKDTDMEKKLRSDAIEKATRHAIEIPFSVMNKALDSFEIIEAMANHGNTNSVSDAGVGALCAMTAIVGAYLNVKINASGLKDNMYKAQVISQAEKIVKNATEIEKRILDKVNEKIQTL